MGSNWEVIDTGVRSAEDNMRYDTALLELADQRVCPVLHLYEWEGDAATYGYFVDPAEYLHLENVSKRGLQLARRPTGGGIVFHQWDMAFSVLVPSHCPEFSENTLANYALVNRAVLASVKEFLHSQPLTLTPEDGEAWDEHCKSFCMAKPTKYDVMWEGKKIAGAAQRKTKKGFLHQGMISLVMPCEEYLSDILLPETQVKEAIKAHSSPLLGTSASSEDIKAAKRSLSSLLATHLNRVSLEFPSL
jgi:lipoate-protein ligase A